MTRNDFLKGVCVLPGLKAAVRETEQIDPKGTYVLRAYSPLCEEQICYIRTYFREKFPELEIILLDDGMTMEELRPLGAADIEAAVERGVSKALDSLFKA